MIELLIRGIVGAAIVIGMTVLTKNSRPDIAGVLLLIPILSITGLFAIGMAQQGNNTAFMIDSIKTSLYSIPLLILFLISTLLLLKFMPYYLALLGAFGIWIIGAILFLFLLK